MLSYLWHEDGQSDDEPEQDAQASAEVVWQDIDAMI